jgi:hypothetical protein
MKKIAFIIGILIAITLASLIVVYILINTNNKENTNNFAEKKDTSQTEKGFQETPNEINEESIKSVVKEYLPKVLETSYGGTVFCGNHYYGYEEYKDISSVNVYVWAYCEEYYIDNGEIKMGSGVSEPVKLRMEYKNNILTVIDHKVPGDGSLYASSIKEMFPEVYQKEAISGFDVSLLFPSPKEQARIYFNI